MYCKIQRLIKPHLSNHISIFRAVLLITILVLATNCNANNLPKNTPQPGGILLKKISCPNNQTPSIYFHNHKIMVIKDTNHADYCYAIVGLSLALKPGTYNLINKTKKTNTKISFNIKQKKYPTHNIKIKNKLMVTPNKKGIQRIKHEHKSTTNILTTWTKTQDIDMHFLKPAKGPISCPFGLHRLFNGQPRSSHKGIDIAANLGSKIIAPSNGKVLYTDDNYFAGNVVYIDHGQGLITQYCHLSKIFVKARQKVTKGQVIGLVGKTGRATGAHLHFGVRLNGTWVNPTLLIQSK
jgi:murein DD-endopeptidase MepM/ murein hydrolase activator NlpD